ncbi:MAG: type II toxin-antitoxin system prevent-host-death family antitoxin [Candidatus Competibacteraceae bacterium]|nr:type II toxin-antitoxin system prevent-host-death family antitoxin [Candidatus Competibacteraceae bacterium]
MQYIINSSGERVSVILPIAEYEALLSRASEDETAYLLREPNGSLLLRAIDDIKNGRNIVERELLPDED